MRIGFITPEYPHSELKHAGGLGTSVKNLCVALTKKGISVDVFVYHQVNEEVFFDDGVCIHTLESKRFRFATWFFYRKYIQNYVNSIVKKKGIQLLEAPDWTGITAFMKFNVPLVIRFHGSDAYFCKLEKRRQKFKNFMFEKLALKGADAFIAPTGYAGEVTRKIFGLNKRKIKTIHYGLQTEEFENKKPDVYDESTILYIGTIIRKKGVFELAHVFNQIIKVNPDAMLILIGSDAADIKTGSVSTFDLVKTEFSEAALQRVNYLGKIPYSEVQTHIKRAHVCVFPSFAETLGMVTIESMALQKPVVNTNIGWGQELIDDGINGFLAHPSDISAYTACILKLLNDKRLCSEIGQNAREKVEQLFDIEKNVDVNILYFNHIIEA